MNYVHAVAVSGSGVPSAVAGTTVLRVDKTEPLTRDRGRAQRLVEPTGEADGRRN